MPRRTFSTELPIPIWNKLKGLAMDWGISPDAAFRRIINEYGETTSPAPGRSPSPKGEPASPPHSPA